MHLAVAKILYPNTKHSIRVFAGALKGSSLSAAAAVGSCCSAFHHRNYTAVKHPFFHASASEPGLLTSTVCNMEDFLPPSLRRFYTDEPASGSLAKVKKTRGRFERFRALIGVWWGRGHHASCITLPLMFLPCDQTCCLIESIYEFSSNGALEMNVTSEEKMPTF